MHYSEDFILRASIDKSASLEADFAAARDTLTKNQSSYLVINSDANKWLLLNYVPMTAYVRDKMLYASSRTCLKEGLGKALFLEDYFFSDIVCVFFLLFSLCHVSASRKSAHCSNT